MSRTPDATRWRPLALGLLAFALLRAGLAFVPTSLLWGLDAYRFVPPWLAVPWVTLSLLALWPGAGARAAPRLTAWGDALVRDSRVVALALTAILVAAVVWLLPDGTLFVGDALLRQLASLSLDRLTPGAPGQILPVDALLHGALPRGLEAAAIMRAPTAIRILGALEAAGLVVLAVLWVRTLGLRGVAALVAVVATVGGGFLLLFTGYGKSPSLLVLAAVAVCALSFRVLALGRGHVALGLTLAAALLVHRSALLLLPAAIVAFLAPAPASSGARARTVSRGRRWLAALPAAVVLVVLAPRLLATFTGFDVGQHLAPSDGGFAGGLFAPATALVRVADLVSFAAWMAPLLLVVPFLPRGGDTAAPAVPGERVLLLALLVPSLIALVVLVPFQGLFRDWDAFAVTGAILAALSARAIGRALDRVPGGAWLGAALVAAVLCPLGAALATQATPAWGIARARSFVVDPPLRSERERALVWDFLGTRYLALGDAERELEAFRASAGIAPNPRILWAWGDAAERSRRFDEARGAYERLVARDSTVVRGWDGLGRVAMELGDVETAWRAAGRLRLLVPEDPDYAAMFVALDSMRAAAPGAGR